MCLFQDTEHECTPSTVYCHTSIWAYMLSHRRYSTIVLADGIISLFRGCRRRIIISSKLQVRLHVLLHNRDRAGRVVDNVGAHAPHQSPAAKKQQRSHESQTRTKEPLIKLDIHDFTIDRKLDKLQVKFGHGPNMLNLCVCIPLERAQTSASDDQAAEGNQVDCLAHLLGRVAVEYLPIHLNLQIT